MHYLGQFLVEQGVITPEQLTDGLRFQGEHNRRIGEVAVDKGMLTPEAVRAICRAQRADAGLFGDIAVRERRLTRRALDELLFFQKVQHTYLGEALLQLGHIDQEQYRRLLERYWALREAGQVSLRYLHDFFAENRLLDSLVTALSLAVRRFAGEQLTVSGIGVAFDPAIFPIRGLFSGQVLGDRPFTALAGLSDGLAARLETALAGAEVKGFKGFFTAVSHYVRDLSREEGLLVTGERLRLGGMIEAPIAERIHVRLAAPSGGAGLVLWLAEVGA